MHVCDPVLIKVLIMLVIQDKSVELLKVWTPKLEGRHISVVLSGHNNDLPKGGKDDAHITTRNVL